MMSEEKKFDDIKVKGFDADIIRKLFRFTGKYRHWFILALIALVLTTVAELALPVVLQQSIDRHILSRWIKTDEKTVLDNELSEKSYRSADGDYFVLESELFLSGERNGNQAGSWFVFPSSLGENLSADTQNLLTPLSEGMALISRQDLDSLEQEEYRIIRQADIDALKGKTVLYFILLTVVLLFSFIQIFTMSWTSQGVMKDVRSNMLSHVMKQSLSYLGDTPVGSLVSRLTSDVETINEFFTSVTISILADASIMIGVLITLFLLNPILAAATLLTLPPVFLGAFLFRRLARKAFRRQRHWISQVNSFLSEHVSGMEIIQIFGREKRTREEFESANGELLKASISEMYVFAVFRPLVNLFTSVSLGVVIYGGALLLNRQLLSLGILIAFIDLIQKFYRPLMDMSEKFTIMQSAMAGGERIFNLLEEDNSIPDEGTAQTSEIKGYIQFENVTFSYRSGEEVLKNLSFTANAGETVAIVGYTGAGKTTIASLAARLWDIDSGHIYLDGKDLRDYSLKDLRRSVQSVQQDVFLFSGSIRDNITLGRNIRDEEILKAAQTVQADGFIDKMDKGFHTELQERGRNLSGGQKQLLSFARAVAHNPSVLILDEATANIDTETEKLIQKAMDKLLEGRTSLVIAHRISTIQKADKILVLSEGRLAESGTHDELLELRGLYYNLYNYQYAATESPVGVSV